MSSHSLFSLCLLLSVFCSVSAYPSLLQHHANVGSLQQLQRGGHGLRGTPQGAPGSVSVINQPRLNLTDEQLLTMVKQKTVCPFMGAGVVSRQLPVFGSLEAPFTLATSVRDLANTGGPASDFGDMLYMIALVNLPGPLNPPPPSWVLGYTPLALAGSIAAHAGHSGILSGPSEQPNAGRFSQAAWDRLLLRVKDGYITRTNLARWCAENNLLDPNAKPIGLQRLLKDLSYFLNNIVGSIFSTIERKKNGSKLLTAEELIPIRAGVLAGLASNLFNSAAEMAFLATALHHSPKTRQAKGGVEFAVHIDDLTSLFIQRRLPNGFTTWLKTKVDFNTHIGPCVKEAAQHYLNGKMKGYKIGQ